MSAWSRQNLPVVAKSKIITARAPSLIEWTSIALLFLACALEVAGAFAHLGRSSFWIDELYTAYFTDGSLADVTVKTLRFDTHTPLFSFILHGWSVLFGRSEAALRAFSAAAAVATLLVLYAASRPLLTRWAALLLIAAISATYFWFDMAQNARSYALALLGASLLQVGLLQAMVAVDHSAMRRAAWWIAAAGIGFGLVHYYVFLLAGLVILVAMVRMQDRQARSILLASGVVLTLLLAGYMALRHAYTTMPSSGEMWFANLWRNPYTYLEFARIAVGGPFSRALLAVLLVVGVSGFAFRKRPDLTSWREQPLLRVAFSSLAVVTLLFAVALLISAAGMPTISERNLAIALPFLWLPVCALADWSVGRWPNAWRQALMLATGALALASASIVGFRAVPLRENLRDALHATAAMPGCAESQIPLSVGSMTPNVYTNLMTYYAPATHFRSLMRDQLTGDATQAFLAERAKRIAAGASSCHALLLMREGNARRANALAKQIAVRAGLAHPVRITGFAHATLRDWHAGRATAVYLLWIE